MVREGLIAVLGSADGITVVGEAGSGEESVVQAGTLRPDIILLELHMGGMGGVSAILP
ncbi:hypothetical protein GCM10009733_087380 [Nonomuraea maheshkhaliensis]|uniref:Response regulatory domain-containing protein n=1 Tax=Nonomuraea maheshkhaliensis TaxID=419590 RepID=A0ABP4SRD7_9ACTN